MIQRTLVEKVKGIPTSDGAGVKLTRVIGTDQLPDLDPFLMLDVFESDQADDYIAGFPPHPHRGFETVTYMLAGKMRHKDNQGNEGVIEKGGIQWMTAGKGIIHSEMPEQEEGLLSGLQLWVNLPASHKMTDPAYQEHPASAIAVEKSDAGSITVISGKTNQGTKGIIQNELTQPVYMDIRLSSGQVFTQSLPVEHNAFIYVLTGNLEIVDADTNIHRHDVLNETELGVLSAGNSVSVKALSDTRFILVAGKPLNEPIVRGGPFVMNTEQELEQAFVDYRSGQF
jgi:redox-sensitive bicupin YhaK (pirin superfamily)